MSRYAARVSPNTCPVDFQPLSLQVLEEPLEFWQRADHDPVFFFEPMNAWIVADWEACEKALIDFQTSSSKTVQAIRLTPDLKERIPRRSRKSPRNSSPAHASALTRLSTTSTARTRRGRSRHALSPSRRTRSAKSPRTSCIGSRAFTGRALRTRGCLASWRSVHLGRNGGLCSDRQE